MLPLRLRYTQFLLGCLYVFTAPVVARAQSGAVSFGSVPLGQNGTALTVTLTFSNSGTASAPEALTEGAPNQDFTIASGGSCAQGQIYQAGATCTEVIVFTPKLAGLRRGAVVIADASGNLLATAYVSGVGSGPQGGLRAIAPPVIYPTPGIPLDKGIAIDGAGDVFVSGENTITSKESVYEIPSGCTQAACVKQMPGNFGAVWGIAVDGAGNLWVGDAGASGAITEILAAGGYTASKTYSGTFGNQIGVAVDGSGNVFFVSSSISSSSTSVIELTSASDYKTAETLASNINMPGSVAVDSSGDVFYVDSSIDGIEKIEAVDGAIPQTPTIQTVAGGIKQPLYIAVDSSDSLFVTTASGLLDEVPPQGGYATVISYSNQFDSPTSVAVDQVGSIYVLNLQTTVTTDGEPIETAVLSELPRTAASALNFITPTAPGETDSLNEGETVSLENTGNQPLDLAKLAISNNNFTLTDSTTCSTSAPLAAGEGCILSVLFDPVSTGNPVTAALTVTDNAANQAEAEQSVALTGTSLYTPTFTVKSPLVVVVTQDLQMTITVNGASGGPVPTGTVQVSAPGYPGSPVPLSNGQASVTIPAGSLPLGTITLTFVYQPDGAGALGYVPVQGQETITVTQTLENSPQVQVVPATGSIAMAQALTVQVNVDQISGSPVPTGSVTLAAGSYASGPQVLSGGSASFNIPANSLPLGTDEILATYMPDAASAAIYLPSDGGAVVSVNASASISGASAVSFGSLGIGVAGELTSVTLTFPAGGTPASVIAATQGGTGLDFALASGGTCGAGMFVPAGASCTANVVFTPAYPGLRNGAVMALDANGAPLATTYIYGTGNGAQLAIESLPPYDIPISNLPAIFPAATTQLGSGYSWPRVTVDGAGNVYVSDEGNNRIQKIPAGCSDSGCAVTIASDLGIPTGLAIDGAGNLFVAELSYGDVKEIPPGCQSISCMATIGAGFSQPNGVAVDSSGNVFVADTGNGAIKEVVAAGGYSTINTLATGLNEPWSVAVDAGDDLFVAQGGNQCTIGFAGLCSTLNTSIVEITAASSYKTVNTIVPENELGFPIGLTLDGSGNLYEADYGDAKSYELLAGKSYQGSQGWILNANSLFADTVSVGRENNGNFAWADVSSGDVFLTEYNQQPSIAFKTGTQNGANDSVDGAQQVYLLNNGNAPLTLSTIALSDPSFHFDSTTTTCSISKPLAPGGDCIIGVDFAPQTYGPINATLTLISNNMNQSAATLVIPIAAVALPPTPVILTYPPNPATANSAAFTFSDTQAPVTFVCSIDGLPFSACSDPASYAALSGGPHTFQAKAEDAVGNLSPAAIYSWTINTVGPPAPVIVSAPDPLSITSAAAFTFTDAQSPVNFLCSLDGAAFVACNSGVSYTVSASTNPTIPMAYHIFAVEAQDASDNVSPETTYTWAYQPTLLDGVGTALNFGAVPVGQTSAAQTVTFTILGKVGQNPGTPDTVASIGVYTLGIAGLDFAVANAGTCAIGDTVAVAGTCTLQASFTPKYAGQRKGAIALVDATGALIGLAYLEGTGTAPQLTFAPYSTVSYNLLQPQNNADPGKNLTAPATDVALDGAGNLFVSDEDIISADGSVNVSLGDIWKFAPGCTSSSCGVLFATNGRSGSSVPNTGNLLLPVGMALDGAGLIWVADGEGFVPELNMNGSWNSWECSYGNQYGVYNRPTVSGAGVASMLAGGGVSLCGGSYSVFSFSTNTPSMTVDPAGNLFVVDQGNNNVGEVLASSNYTIARVVAGGFNSPSGIASDAFGNLYVADTGNNAIKELTVASGYAQAVTVATFAPGTITLGNLAIDALGNLYAVNSGSATNQVMKIDVSDVPALSFPTSTQVGSTDTTDGTLSATVKNNGNAPLALSGLAISGNSFQLDSSATTCAAGTTLAAGDTCTIGVIFAAQANGALSGSVTLTDNVLNATGTTQVFALSGNGVTGPVTVQPTVTAMPANANITTAQSDTVTVTVSGTSGKPVPTGTVTLSGGGYTSASVTLTGGSASFTILPGELAPGSTTINAVYTPDAASSNIYGAGAGSTSITVTSAAKTTPTVSVMPALLDVSTAQSLPVTVAVNAGDGNPIPTGSVTVSAGNYGSLAVTLVNGSASITIPSGSLPAGQITINAYYTPDAAGSANFNSASGSGQVSVEAAPLVTPVLVVTPASNSIATAQPLVVTVQLTVGSGEPVPTGSVVLSTGNYSSLPAPISQGGVILTIPAGTLSGGTNTITAAYTPDKASALTYNAATGNASVSVNAGQTITFAQPSSPVTYSPGLTIALSATGGASGNPVVFTIDASSTGVGTISGSSLSVIDAGTFVIDANQAGNANYSAAPQVQRVVVVAQIAQTITFAQPGSPLIFSAGLTIPLSATGGNSGNPVVFTLDASSSGMGSISGSMLTVTAPGTFVIDANQAGNVNYSPAAQVQRTVVVNTLTAQTINFTQPASPVVYSPGLTVSLSATGGASGNPVVFTIDPSSTGVGSISGSTLNISQAGTLVIDANQAGNANFSAAPQVQRTLIVTQAPQAIDFTQPATPVTYTPGLTIQLSATGGMSGNPVVFSIDTTSTGNGSISGSMLIVGAVGTFVIDANQAGSANYLAASQVQRTITVNLLPPDFTVTMAPSTLSIPPGGTANFTATVAATNGSFSSPVNLSVSGLPA